MSKIHTAIPAIMGEVGAIEKSRKNQQQGYAFRGIDDAYAAFQSLFAKHGVFVLPTVLDSKREERTTKSGGALIYTTLTVKHTFCADDGSSLDCVTIGEAMDSGDKSSNKAMSAAMKYALLEVFCVPTEADNDTENHSHEPAPKRTEQPKPAAASNGHCSEAQIKRIYAIAKQGGIDTTTIPETLARSYPYIKDETGVHLLHLKTTDYDAAVKLFEADNIPFDVPAEKPLTPPKGIKEIWPESTFDDATEVITAPIVNVLEPKISPKSGKPGPYKVEIQTDGQVVTLDTFDAPLAALAMDYGAGGEPHEIAFRNSVNGKYTNRSLIGLR